MPQEVILDLRVSDVDQKEEDRVIVQSEVLAEPLLIHDGLVVDLAILGSLVLLPPPLLLVFLLLSALVGFLEDSLRLLLLSFLFLGST